MLLGVIAVGLITLWHHPWFLSALLGVAAMFIASFYLVLGLWFMERNFGKTRPKPLKAFYTGQIIKYAVLIILTLSYIHWLHLNYLAVIIGILAVQLANNFLLIKVKRSINAKS